MSARPWSVEDALLYALVGKAWELRGEPEFPEAISAILDAFDRSPVAWLERCEQRRARTRWLVDVLRETDPARQAA